MRLTNLTPHPLVLRDTDGVDTVLPPSGTVARVTATPGPLTSRPGVPVPVAGPTIYGEVEGLPAPQDGVGYLVSGVVLARVRRPDVFAPGTGPGDGAVRDAAGRIIAVTRLISAV